MRTLSDIAWMVVGLAIVGLVSAGVILGALAILAWILSGVT